MKSKKRISLILSCMLIITTLTGLGVCSYATEMDENVSEEYVEEVDQDQINVDITDSDSNIGEEETVIAESFMLNPFIDVNEDNWFYHDVMNVYKRKIMLGTSDNEFSPLLKTTRGTVVTLLHRAAGSPSGLKATGFTDVEEGSWYYDSVNWAYQNSIVLGYSETEFAPNDLITKEQFVTVLYRYNNYMIDYEATKSENTYNDTEEKLDNTEFYVDTADYGVLDAENTISNIQEDAAVQLQDEKKQEEGSNRSIDDTEISNSDELNDSESGNYINVTDVDLTTIFHDGTSVSNYAADAIKWAYVENYIVGDESGNLNPSELINRSQIATIISRYFGDYTEIDESENEDGSISSASASGNSGSGIYVLRSALNNNMVVDVAGGSKESKANVQLYRCNNSAAQKFVFIKNGDYFYIKNLNSNKVLDVCGGSKNSGTNVWQYNYNGSASQKWQLYNAGNGYVYIKSALGNYLDVFGGWKINGTNIQVYKGNGSASQKFKLVGVNFKNVSDLTTTQGIGVPLSGTISSTNVKIKSISTSVQYGSKKMSKTVYPDSYSYNFYNSALDQAMKFGSIPVGTYKILYIVNTDDGLTFSGTTNLTVKKQADRFNVQNYNVGKALKFASENATKNSQWLCAEYVARCLRAGNINIPAYTGCTDMRNSFLVKSGLIKEYRLNVENNGTVLWKNNKGKIAPGDVVLLYWAGETDGRPYEHAVLISEVPTNTPVKVYAHNDSHNNDEYEYFNTWRGHPVTAYCYHFN